MKKLLVISLAAFLVVSGMQVPSAAAKTTSEASATNNTSFEFSKNLYFGLRNNPNVVELQEFLTEQGFYAGPVTGNFFLLTLQAVKKFQAAQGVSATGFFGPKSRGVANGILKNLIGRICMSEEECPDVLPNPTLTITTDSDLRATVGKYFAATFKASGGAAGMYDIKGYGEAPGLSWMQTYCPEGMVCAQVISPDTITLSGTPKKAGAFNVTVVAREMQTIVCIRAEGCPVGQVVRYGKASFTILVGGGFESGAPVVKGVKGPTILKVGEEGTWTISAYDPDGGSLSYAVDWGDETGTGTAREGVLAPSALFFVQTATFSHTYRAAGTYTVKVRVADNTGMEAKASITVYVKEVVGGEPWIRVISPNGGEQWQVGRTYLITWKSANFPANGVVTIALEDVNTINAYLFSEIANDGSEAWTVPNTVLTGKYRMRITCGIKGSERYCSGDGTRNSNVEDYSDNYFVIESSSTTEESSMRVISPSGGKVIPQGTSNFRIDWRLTNATSLVAPSYQIDLLRNGSVLGWVVRTGLGTPSNYYTDPTLWNFSWAPGTYTDGSGYLQKAVAGDNFTLRATLFESNREIFRHETGAFSIIPLPREVSLASLTPSSGAVGATVVAKGAGFTSTGNIVYFGGGVVPNLASADGETIMFTVPAVIKPLCLFAKPIACLVVEQETTPGTYVVQVVNANGNGTNARSFVVTATGY